MTNNNAYNDVMETIQHHGLDGMVPPSVKIVGTSLDVTLSKQSGADRGPNEIPKTTT